MPETTVTPALPNTGLQQALSDPGLQQELRDISRVEKGYVYNAVTPNLAQQQIYQAAVQDMARAATYLETANLYKCAHELSGSALENIISVYQTTLVLGAKEIELLEQASKNLDEMQRIFPRNNPGLKIELDQCRSEIAYVIKEGRTRTGYKGTVNSLQNTHDTLKRITTWYTSREIENLTKADACIENVLTQSKSLNTQMAERLEKGSQALKNASKSRLTPPPRTPRTLRAVSEVPHVVHVPRIPPPEAFRPASGAELRTVGRVVDDVPHVVHVPRIPPPEAFRPASEAVSKIHNQTLAKVIGGVLAAGFAGSKAYAYADMKQDMADDKQYTEGLRAERLKQQQEAARPQDTVQVAGQDPAQATLPKPTGN